MDYNTYQIEKISNEIHEDLNMEEVMSEEEFEQCMDDVYYAAMDMEEDPDEPWDYDDEGDEDEV